MIPFYLGKKGVVKVHFRGYAAAANAALNICADD